MNDYIKREDAIKALERWHISGVLLLAPVQSADVRENVRGEWQKVDEQPYFRKHFHKVCCSVCRKQGYDYWNYCPNCGADMRGDKK